MGSTEGRAPEGGDGLWSGLRALAGAEPLAITVGGDCMAPGVRDGARVEVAPRRWYWPGDVVAAVPHPEGAMRLHRVLGYHRLRADPTTGRAGGWALVTRGDRSPAADAPTPLARVLGRPVGGQCAPAIRRPALADRARAAGRYLGWLCDGVVRRARRPGSGGGLEVGR